MIRIQRAEQKHIPEIIEIRGDSPFGYEDYLCGQIEATNAQVLVAIEADKVIGYSWALVREDISVFGRCRYGSVAEIEVRPQYRRQGIGAKLFSEVKRWLADNGISQIEVRVHSGNHAGYSFWRRQGFEDYVRVMRLDVT